MTYIVFVSFFLFVTLKILTLLMFNLLEERTSYSRAVELKLLLCSIGTATGAFNNDNDRNATVLRIKGVYGDL